MKYKFLDQYHTVYIRNRTPTRILLPRGSEFLTTAYWFQYMLISLAHSYH